MRGLPAGVYIPGYSSLHRLDARAKIVSLLLLITAMAVTSTLYGYLVILGVVAGIFRLSGLPYRAVLAPVGRLWPFFLLIFPANLSCKSVRKSSYRCHSKSKCRPLPATSPSSRQASVC